MLVIGRIIIIYYYWPMADGKEQQLQKWFFYTSFYKNYF